TLPTVGIWKPASLRLETRAAIADVAFSTLEIAPDRARARVAVTVTVEAFAEPGALAAKVRLAAPDGALAAEGAAQVRNGVARIELALASPRLWWTPELGAPDRYALDVELVAGGEALDRRDLMVGVRTIGLDQSPDPDEPGATFFRFLVNGVPIFARGVCWIPSSSFVAAVDEAHYRRLLEKALDANMNMIRIWGGGVYEHDAFYDLCDELGLLVWQDFMFACAPYPDDDPAFVENVAAEVRAQVKRLRSHPSMALWCGNNENQWIYAGLNEAARRDGPMPGARLYDDVMPALVAELDPTTPYWPSSPWGGPHPDSMIAGDVHDWTVWHGVPPVPVDRPVGKFSLEPEAVAYTRYAENMSRFVSEYGIQASPAMETLRRALPEDQRALGSPGLLARIKD
ncbi:MAG: glycoside hydrolase family 2 protein, partial [Caulobacteraceae bacterium]